MVLHRLSSRIMMRSGSFLQEEASIDFKGGNAIPVHYWLAQYNLSVVQISKETTIASRGQRGT